MDNNENIQEKLEKLIAKIPHEEQVKFYKHLANNAGLREDDSMYVLLLTMGYIKTMYEDIPNAMQVLDESIEKKVKGIEETLQQSLGNFKQEIDVFFEKKKDELMSEQFKAMVVFSEGAKDYMEVVDKVNRDTEQFIRDKQASMRKLMVENIKEDFPKIVNQHLKTFIEESTDTGWKKFFFSSAKAIFLITCGILFSEVARSMFH